MLGNLRKDVPMDMDELKELIQRWGKPKKKNNMLLWITVVSGVIAVIAGVVVWFMLRKQDDEYDEDFEEDFDEDYYGYDDEEDDEIIEIGNETYESEQLEMDLEESMQAELEDGDEEETEEDLTEEEENKEE